MDERLAQRRLKSKGLWRRHGSGSLDFALSMFVWVSSAPLAFAANVLLARLLGPNDYGRYMSLLAAGLVGSGIAAYGVAPLLTREIAADTGKVGARKAVLSAGLWALRFTGILSVCTMAVVFAWLFVGPGAPVSNIGDRFAVVFIIPASVTSMVMTGVLGGLSQVAKSQAIRNVIKNGFLLLSVIGLFLAGSRRVSDILWLQALSFVFAAAIGVYWIWRSVPVAMSPGPDARRLTWGSKEQHRDWRKSSTHFFAISVTTLILLRMDVIIVNALAGDRQAGLFGAAARIAQIAQIAGLVWMAWLRPRFARDVGRGNTESVKGLVWRGLIGSVVMSATIIGVAWVMAPRLMHLLGKGFEDATWTFRWLLLGYLVWSCATPFIALMSMSGREGVLSRVLWIQVFLTLAASLPLVSNFGALGGAGAWAGGMAATDLILIWAGLTGLYRKQPLVTT